MNWKQFLTEKVLKEQWHYTVGVRYSEHFGNLEKCSCGRVECDEENRSFATEAEMMALYRQIEKDGKWKGFYRHTHLKIFASELPDTVFTKWLFCLDGIGYEDRCKMVADFYGWEGEK